MIITGQIWSIQKNRSTSFWRRCRRLYLVFGSSANYLEILVYKEKSINIHTQAYAKTSSFQSFYKKNYTGHRSAFFNLSSPNESRPPVYTLHLKCFPIKGEPSLVERLLQRLLPPLNAHAMFTWTHSHIYINIPIE